MRGSVCVGLLALLLSAGCRRARRTIPTGRSRSWSDSRPAAAPTSRPASSRQEMSKGLGQSLLIENKPGAAGTLGAAEAARSAPDGYTLLVTPGGHAIFGAMFKSLPFHTVNSFDWISNIVTIPFFIVVPANSEFKTLADVVAKAKAAPGTVTFGSTGPGSTHHLGIELLGSRTGAKFLHVPYRGDAPIITALLASEIQFSIVTPTQAIENVKAGKFRALADHRQHARRQHAGRADRRAGARHHRLRRAELVRDGGAGRHAQAGDRPPERRGAQGGRRAGGEGAARRRWAASRPPARRRRCATAWRASSRPGPRRWTTRGREAVAIAGHPSRPHPDEARSAVSKDGAGLRPFETAPSAAPQDEGGRRRLYLAHEAELLHHRLVGGAEQHRAVVAVMRVLAARTAPRSRRRASSAASRRPPSVVPSPCTTPNTLLAIALRGGVALPGLSWIIDSAMVSSAGSPSAISTWLEPFAFASASVEPALGVAPRGNASARRWAP